MVREQEIRKIKYLSRKGEHNMENFEDTIELTNKPMIDNNLIQNLELRRFIEYKLDSDELSKEKLASIDEIILDSENIIGQYNKVYFEEIALFPRLKKIAIRNLGLSSDDMSKLTPIEQIEFKNCEIKDINKLKNVKHLILIHTELETEQELEALVNLEEIQLINMDINNFEFLKKLSNLKKLVIKNVNQFSLAKINFALPIEYLSIEDIQNLDLNVIAKYENLKTLSVDGNDSRKMENDLEALKRQDIEILLNDIYEY